MSAHTEAEAGWNSKFRRGPTAQKLVALKCFCKPTDPHLLGVGSAPSPTTDNFFVCLSGRDDVYKNSQRLAYTKYFCSFRPTWAKNWRSSSSSLIIPWGFTFKFTFCLVVQPLSLQRQSRYQVFVLRLDFVLPSSFCTVVYVFLDYKYYQTASKNYSGRQTFVACVGSKWQWIDFLLLLLPHNQKMLSKKNCSSHSKILEAARHVLQARL